MNTKNPSLQRLPSIDMMRGLVIVLMALDHTRDFFSNALFDPTDLSKTFPALFMTRWITHLCAPTFVFLAGISAFLAKIRHQQTHYQFASHLLSRGIWLVILELTVVRLGWTFVWDMHQLLGQVIWALGWSMISLAALSFLPRSAILIFALGMIGSHNLSDHLQPNDFGPWAWLWTILHTPGHITFLTDFSFFALYPLIPWIGVMAAGYCFGDVLLLPKHQRQHWLLYLGLACLLMFIFLRSLNLYGDAQLWTPQKNWLFTCLAFLNVTKYPPSLQYLLVTLGIMLIGLNYLESKQLPLISHPLIIFGKVPMFFYLIHLFMIHGAMLIITWWRGFPIDWLFDRSFPSVPIADYGYSLPVVYAFWLCLLLMLYPLCRGFAHLKHKSPNNVWMKYL